MSIADIVLRAKVIQAGRWVQAGERVEELRSLLAPLGECDVVWDDDAAGYVVRPREWKGLVAFTARPHRLFGWRIFYYGRGIGSAFGYKLRSVDDWYQKSLTDFVVELNNRYEQRVSIQITFAVRRLHYADDRTMAARHHADLLKIAPERAAEWDDMLALWNEREREKQAAVE